MLQNTSESNTKFAQLNYIQQIHADEEVDKIKVFSLGAPQPMFKEAELWEICEGK